MSETKKQKILIADDDKFLSDMYALKFDQSGFDVSVAHGGPEALDLVDKGEGFDIFLVDVVMPEMDGFRLVEELRKREALSGSAIVILTNLGQQEDVERGLKAGADGYVVKASATPSEVVGKVSAIVQKIKD